MTKDSSVRAFLVVLMVAVVSSALVSSTVVVLRPIQLNNALIERGSIIMQLTGLLPPGESPDDETMLELFKSLDRRIVDLDAAVFDAEINPDTFDERKASASEKFGVAIPTELDVAKLGSRSKYVTAYLVWEDDRLDRVILPIQGSGMWSMLYGYVALEGDLNTIAAAIFYEHGETPGLGDQITRPDWLAQWQGRQIYTDQGEVAFGVGPGRIESGSPLERYKVDAVTGATVTSDAVTKLVDYWFGPHCYQPFLKQLREQPPIPGSQMEEA